MSLLAATLLGTQYPGGWGQEPAGSPASQPTSSGHYQEKWESRGPCWQALPTFWTSAPNAEQTKESKKNRSRESWRFPQCLSAGSQAGHGPRRTGCHQQHRPWLLPEGGGAGGRSSHRLHLDFTLGCLVEGVVSPSLLRHLRTGSTGSHASLSPQQRPLPSLSRAQQSPIGKAVREERCRARRRLGGLCEFQGAAIPRTDGRGHVNSFRLMPGLAFQNKKRKPI